MRYPIVVKPKDANGVYAVIVPDLPGCLCSGHSLEEAFKNAQEAVLGWLECEVNEGNLLPAPSRLDDLPGKQDYTGCIFGFVDIAPSLLAKKSERINISIPTRLLHFLDELAAAEGETRSGYIAKMVVERVAHRKHIIEKAAQ